LYSWIASFNTTLLLSLFYFNLFGVSTLIKIYLHKENLPAKLAIIEDRIFYLFGIESGTSKLKMVPLPCATSIYEKIQLKVTFIISLLYYFCKTTKQTNTKCLLMSDKIKTVIWNTNKHSKSWTYIRTWCWFLPAIGCIYKQRKGASVNSGSYLCIIGIAFSD